MRFKIFQILTALVMIAVALIGTVQQVSAQTSEFCNGKAGFIFDHLTLDENKPPCGDVLYILIAPWKDGGPYNPNYQVVDTWANHVRYLKANGLTNGSFWVKTSTSSPSGAQLGKFNCAIGSSNVVSGAIISAEPCPPNSVQYALEVNKVVTRFTSWASAEKLRNGQNATYWIEALPQSATPSGGFDLGAFLNWFASWWFILCCLVPILIGGLIALIVWLLRRAQPTTP